MLYHNILFFVRPKLSPPPKVYYIIIFFSCPLFPRPLSPLMWLGLQETEDHFSLFIPCSLLVVHDASRLRCICCQRSIVLT